MALWKPFRGNRAALDTVEKHDGYVYFCVDDGTLFFDYIDSEGNLQRKQINAKDAETIMGMPLTELQSDWSVNDETDPAYVKNRPFYTTDPQEVELCNGTYDFSDISESGLSLYRAKIDADSTYFVDEIGQEVRIIYDGTTYDLTSKYISTMGTYYVGNGSLFNDLGLTEENTGEPFAYTLGAYFFTSETDAQHTIKIYINKVTDITIPHKYIGLNVWTGDGKDSVVANNADNVASGYRAFAIGLSTTASGASSHAEGSETTASGDNSHAEGNDTTASNFNSHAEGCETVASGHSAHAEGVRTEAAGQGSHAEGQNTKTSAWNAHAEGQGTEAASKSQHVFGEYNIVDKSAGVAERGKYIQIAGNGGSENDKSNAYTLDWSGNAWFKGDVKVGGTGHDDAAAKTLATTDDLSWNNLKDRPFYFTENMTLYDSTITTSDMGGVYAYMDQSDTAKTTPSLIEGETYTVTFDDNTYTCTCSNGTHIGNLSLVNAGDATDEPFAIFVQAGAYVGVVATDSANTTHTIKIEGPAIKTIDEKYLPQLPYVTLQEGNQYWVDKSDFAQTNSNLTYKGKTYSTNHEYFMFFLTTEGIWRISLVPFNSVQIPSTGSFRMNYASSDGTLSFYWSNESNTTEINTVMYAYLYDVNTGDIIRRESSVQSVTIGAYTKKSHNFDFYINRSTPQDAKIVRSFDDYIDVEAALAEKVQSFLPKSTTVTIPAASWTGDANPWSQVVTVNGVTANSKVDLQPTATQIVELQNEEIMLMLQNDAGVVTAWAIGNKPLVDYTMQVLITEVVVV